MLGTSFLVFVLSYIGHSQPVSCIHDQCIANSCKPIDYLRRKFGFWVLPGGPNTLKCSHFAELQHRSPKKTPLYNQRLIHNFSTASGNRTSEKRPPHKWSDSPSTQLDEGPGSPALAFVSHEILLLLLANSKPGLAFFYVILFWKIHGSES